MTLAGTWGRLAPLGEDAVVADLRLDKRDDVWPLSVAPPLIHQHGLRILVIDPAL